MNERIRELAYKVWYMPCSDNEHHLALEKFAELIVRECAEVANENVGAFTPGCGNSVLEHFGVEVEATRQALAQISPSDYALIHKDALRAWGKLGELEAACCYSMQPEQEPSKQFHEWACAEHQKILAESANSTTGVVESKVLAQPEQDCYEYAARLAKNLWKAHYKEWKPFDNLSGGLKQIDNMAPGLVKAQPEQEPVAWMYEWNGEKHLTFTDQSFVEKAHPHFNKSIPLYTAPPKRGWVGLTDDDKREFAAAQYGWEDLLAAADAKLKEKNA